MAAIGGSIDGARAGALDARLERARSAARALRLASRESKDRVLARAAALVGERSTQILDANAADLAAAGGAGVTSAFLDRLRLTPERLAQMKASLEQVGQAPDPVGEQVDARVLANGLRAQRVRAPLGVIFLIFESRPNVALESFSLAFKAGNAIILRGGKESMRTTGALYSVMADALSEGGLSSDCVWGITDPDRGITDYLLAQKRAIDVVVPRGGEKLIEYVTENSAIPVIKNDRGLCHVYIHEDADLPMAEKIVFNAKLQRPGVCNAMETLLVHRSVAQPILLALHASCKGLRWNGCAETMTILAGKMEVKPASSTSWDTEYLDTEINAKVVGSLDEAIDHIERHGSGHSEAIVTRNSDAARDFERRVDAAAVYWNASTRFTDGFALGLGGELGISTQKLHVRGPVGLRELTSVRWIIEGEGQVRS